MAENTQQQVETVVIEEPSDKVELAHDEKPRCTKTRVYVALGLLVVIAVSLIGTLLSFSPSSNAGINQQSLTEGTQATFPTFDTNNDGFIDQNEMSNWMSERIAARKGFCTPEDPEPTATINSDATGNSSTTPTSASVNSVMNPCDFNHDGKISRTEAVECVIYLFELFIKQWGHATPPRTMNTAALTTQTAPAPTDCPVPGSKGFPGKVPKGWVGACALSEELWCFTHELCHHKKKCHTEVIPGSWQVQDTCCAGTSGANCTTCECGATYHFVPHGHNARATSMCHPFATFWCGDIDTGVPVW
jgi:hypothetical protein